LNPPERELNQIESPDQDLLEALFFSGVRQVLATPSVKLQKTSIASLLQPLLGSTQ
jgi:hypothetical protein